MTAIIAIFDDSKALEKAVVDLNGQGFRERVFDKAILSREIGVGVRPVHSPGMGPLSGSAGIFGSVPETTDDSAIIGAFKEHLTTLRLSEEQIDNYINHFNHEGKFLIVKVGSDKAEQAIGILREANASQVNRHG